MYKSATNFVAEQLGIDFPTSQPGDGLAMCNAQVRHLKYLAGHGIEANHHGAISHLSGNCFELLSRDTCVAGVVGVSTREVSGQLSIHCARAMKSAFLNPC